MPISCRALAHRVRDQGVDAERREQQREAGKAAEQHHQEAPRRDRSIDELLQRPEVVAGQVGGDRLQLGADGAGELRRRQGRAHDEIGRRPVAALAHRDVHLVAGALLERQVPDVADDADDPPLLGAAAEDVLADRILTREHSVRAIVSLMTMTGSLVAVSLAAMSRPARSGMPIAAA